MEFDLWKIKELEEAERKNPQIASLKKSLLKKFPRFDFFLAWPAKNSPEDKTDIVWTNGEQYLKWFTRTWRILWKTELQLINLFNEFSKKINIDIWNQPDVSGAKKLNDSKDATTLQTSTQNTKEGVVEWTEVKVNFLWPTILDSADTSDWWFYFLMDDAKKWGKEELDFSKMKSEEIMEIWGREELDFSKMKPEEIMRMYKKLRKAFDNFEEYSKWKTSTETNPLQQKMYSIAKRHRNNIFINLMRNPALSYVIRKKYYSKINGRISNGQGKVKDFLIGSLQEEYNNQGKMKIFSQEEISHTLKSLLSKVKTFDFEYNFWRFWTWHVFSDETRTNNVLIDFDNVCYQIKWTEVINIMWSNLLWLQAVKNYKSYEARKENYDRWYRIILETYKDKNLIKLLLFIKLIWTIFQDYWHLDYKRYIENWKEEEKRENEEEIKKWIQWNYKVLQDLINEEKWGN